VGGSGGVSLCRAGRRERGGSFGKLKYILGWAKIPHIFKLILFRKVGIIFVMCSQWGRYFSLSKATKFFKVYLAENLF
jgi:hypothetical protein